MNKTIFGDCRESMRLLIAQGVRVQTCVTSPPYFGLRDYGHPGQIGLESTVDEYVATLVDVFRLVRDLLADDGVLWLNLGDSYAGSWGAQSREHAGKHSPNVSALSANQVKAAAIRESGTGSIARTPGLKPKDLIGVPWRVVFALQADGWWLRQDIIWHKPNPMPESVRDRCTKAHEYLFLLTKSERYYWDYEAMQERSVGANAHDITGGFMAGQVPGASPQSGTRKSGNKERKPASARGVPVDDGGKSAGAVAGSVPWEGYARNRRSVWTVRTEPFDGAHFATYPSKLVEPCILTTSRPGHVVLDPFMGSGTTGQVAQALGRRWIGCEINEDYAPLQAERTAQQVLRLHEESEEA